MSPKNKTKKTVCVCSLKIRLIRFWRAILKVFCQNSLRSRPVLPDSFLEPPNPPTSLCFTLFAGSSMSKESSSNSRLLCFKIVSYQDLTYLSEFLHPYIPYRKLCSFVDSQVFKLPSFYTKSSGQSTFCFSF